jgi:hypothetical protein
MCWPAALTVEIARVIMDNSADMMRIRRGDGG